MKNPCNEIWYKFFYQKVFLHGMLLTICNPSAYYFSSLAKNVTSKVMYRIETKNIINFQNKIRPKYFVSNLLDIWSIHIEFIRTQLSFYIFINMLRTWSDTTFMLKSTFALIYSLCQKHRHTFGCTFQNTNIYLFMNFPHSVCSILFYQQ